MRVEPTAVTAIIAAMTCARDVNLLSSMSTQFMVGRGLGGEDRSDQRLLQDAIATMDKVVVAPACKPSYVSAALAQ